MERLHPTGRLWNLCFFLIVAATTLPLWNVRYLPIQDLPQHLAAIRVLHSHGDPSFDFARYFELDLFRTQYLAYYLCAHWLSFLFDVEVANHMLVVACIVGTPYALRSLLRVQGRDERLALFSLPLAYNAHFILGFVNFLLAIPLALYGLSLAIQQRSAPSRARAVLLACVAVVTFYAHVVPFALLCLGVGLIALQRNQLATILGVSPLLPAGAAAGVWAAHSPAGQATLTAARGTTAGVAPVFQSTDAALADLPNWLTEILRAPDDTHLLRAFLVLLGLSFVFGVLRARAHAAPTQDFGLRLALLPMVAAALYFVAPTSYAWIWPIAQRFPLLALLFFIAVLPTPPRHVATLLLSLVLGVTALQVQRVAAAFAHFDTVEVGDFDLALAHVPPRQRVAGLIHDRGSSQVKFSPFIHYVAYYQARKGGATMFTFADFPQSPFRFRDDNRPPPVPPRWEWMPERVKPRDLAWYDYVLVRGSGTQLTRARSQFTRIYQGPRWSVWKKLR